MPFVRFAIANPLLVNLFLVLIVIGGVVSWRAMPQEMFPVVDQDQAQITTEFEGAPPAEVEAQVTLPVEEAFDGMADIDVITSTSAEGLSTVVVELRPSTDVDEFMRQAREALDQITDLPEEAEEPELTRVKTRFPVISVSLYGDVAPGYLYDLADETKRRLLALDGVAGVGVAGQREWELWVITDPRALAARDVALAEVAAALRRNLRDLPGGSLKAADGDILLRGEGVPADPEAVEAVALRSDDDGGTLTLGQVARVDRRLEEAKTLGRFNGKPSVNLRVTKTAEASTIDVARRVRTLTAEMQRELPAGVSVGHFSDLSRYVKNRLDTVKSSGLVGLVLVLLSLYLFLNFRVAGITALGIPVSFLVAVILIYALGYTINMVSLFAFLIALGMIVDDAIIVTENIYRHREAGVGPTDAALRGAREVFWPVVASTTTTVAAFLPMFAVGGTMGAFIEVIPVVVSAALIGSLVEAFGVLPSHAKEFLRVRRETAAGARQRGWARALALYTGVVRWALAWRYAVIVAAVGVLAVTVAFAATRMPFQLFGHAELGQFFINAEAPSTYSLDDTSRLAKRMEREIDDELADHELQSLLTNVGFTFTERARLASNRVQMVVDLKRQRAEGFIERYVSPLVSLSFERPGTRERATEDIINALRARLNRLAGIERLSVARLQGGPTGPDVEVGVAGPDVDVLRHQAAAIVDHLERMPGVHDVRQDLEAGKLEYRYALNARGRELGLTQAALAEAVRSGFLGVEVLHVTQANERMPVRVIYPESVRRDLDLERLPITLADGRTVYLGEVADVRLQRGVSTIKRRNGRRLATVTAQVDDRVTTPLQVSDAVRQRFDALDPGYELLFLGERQAAAESLAGMRSAAIIAVALIFFILAALFRSLLDPMVVMLAIPFGAIGVVAGHVVFGFHLQFLSLIGFLALAGIVVNDSLILVDFAKRRRREGLDRIEAMVEAGRVRVRPILLTSVTTFLGISPLIFFATGQTAFLSPMAVALGFGLLFATALILVVIPCLYLVADDLRQWACRRLRRMLGRSEVPDEPTDACHLGEPRDA